MTTPWPPRIAAFVLWALAALSTAYWLLQTIGMDEAPVTAGAIGTQAPVVDTRQLARALGPDPASGSATAVAAAPRPQGPDPAARMQLLGVAADRRAGGVALIAIDGEPPRPFRVGSTVDAGYRLTRVAARSATLSPTRTDGPSFTLELPPQAQTSPQRPALPAGPAAARIPGLPPAAPVPRPPLPVAAPPAVAAEPATETADTPARD